MPAQTLAQRREALRQANEVRLGRAALKRDLAAQRVALEAVLADPPAVARSAKVADLLRQLPRLGPRRVARLLASCRISEGKTVAGLSPRQRAELIARLRERPAPLPTPSPVRLGHAREPRPGANSADA